MKWKKVGKIISKSAPLIGTLLGGPAGGTIGALVSNVLGCENNPAAVYSLLKTNPELIAKIKQAELEHDSELKEISFRYAQAQASVITAEAKGESWLQRNWRPMTMLVFVFIIFNNYILYPYLKLIFNAGVMLETPDQLWQLLKLGISGYIVGRSVEKGIKYWKAGE